MNNFSLDFNDVFESKTTIKDGTYEVIVSDCREDATPGGAEFVQFDLVIRNDFDQAFKNCHIFHKVWRSKKDNKYNMKQFNTIAKACKLQNGKSYKTFDELLNDFIYKTASVTVRNETSEYNGKTYENVNVKFWDESKTNGHNHKFKDASYLDAFTVEVNDDSLPF